MLGEIGDANNEIPDPLNADGRNELIAIIPEE
jgi:hypothetical protein